MPWEGVKSRLTRFSRDPIVGGVCHVHPFSTGRWGRAVREESPCTHRGTEGSERNQWTDRSERCLERAAAHRDSFGVERMSLEHAHLLL